MSASEVAGVVPISNWNSAAGAASTVPLALLDADRYPQRGHRDLDGQQHLDAADRGPARQSSDDEGFIRLGEHVDDDRVGRPAGAVDVERLRLRRRRQPEYYAVPRTARSAAQG